MSVRIEEGSCFCGSISAEMRGEPFWICYDHDDDCRKAIGSPLTVWIGYRISDFRITGDTPKEFSKTKGVVRTFCPECGTSIGYFDEGLEGKIYLNIGFMNSPERFKPEAHAYWKMRLPWVEFYDGLPQIDEYSRGRDPKAGNPSDR